MEGSPLLLKREALGLDMSGPEPLLSFGEVFENGGNTFRMFKVWVEPEMCLPRLLSVSVDRWWPWVIGPNITVHNDCRGSTGISSRRELAVSRFPPLDLGRRCDSCIDGVVHDGFWFQNPCVRVTAAPVMLEGGMSLGGVDQHVDLRERTPLSTRDTRLDGVIETISSLLPPAFVLAATSLAFFKVKNEGTEPALLTWYMQDADIDAEEAARKVDVTVEVRISS